MILVDYVSESGEAGGKNAAHYTRHKEIPANSGNGSFPALPGCLRGWKQRQGSLLCCISETAKPGQGGIGNS